MGGQPILLVARYIGPRARDLFAAENVSYLDLTGNVRSGRRVVGPTWRSMAATTPRTRSTSATSLRPARGVREESASPSATRGRDWRRARTEQVSSPWGDVVFDYHHLPR